MKKLSLVSCMLLSAALLSFHAYGDDAPAPQAPAAPQDVKLTPEMQATFSQLLKMLNPDQNGAPQTGAPDAAKMAPLISQLLKSLGSEQGGNQGGTVDASKLAPMVGQLMRMLDMDSTDDSKPTPAPAPSPSSPSNDSHKPQQPAPLQTHSLRTSGLSTATLGGPRMTNDQWRDLFPAHH